MKRGVSNEDSLISLRDIPLLKRIESTEYKGGIQNWSFDQDSSGILYVANNDGLLEFDGSQWIMHEVPFCTKVRAVLVDANNRIYVGGQGQIGYFSSTVNGLKFTSLLNLIPEDQRIVAETWKIIENQGIIYFNTESQLIAYDGNNLKVLELPGYIIHAFDVNGRLFVQFYDIGLFEWVNDQFIHIVETNKIAEIIEIFQVVDTYYYFHRSGEVVMHDIDGLKKIKIPLDFGTINDVVRLKTGDYIVGTQNKGLYFLSEDFIPTIHLTKNEGISDYTVKAMYEDGFGNLWVALNNGIDYLELSLPLSFINDEVGAEGTGYAALNYNNKVYLGTSNGLFVQTNSNNLANRYYKLIPGSEGQVYNISEVNNKIILNHNRGAFEIEDESLYQFHDIGSWVFINSKNPDLILGGDYQGISLYEELNGRLSKVSTLENLYESSRILEYENDSTLWMTHGTKGAFRLSFDKNNDELKEIKRFGDGDGFPSNIMISVYRLVDNLIFTGEQGIYNFNPSSQKFFPNPFFNKWLGLGHVSELVSNGSNTIYYIQNQKFGILQQITFGTYKNETGLFKHINKYINDDLPNISLIDNNNVLIGAKEGFIRYNPSKKFSINEDFNVILKSVVIYLSPDSIVAFDPYFVEDKEIEKNKSIMFKYAAPYFDGMDDIMYSYRLLPLDTNWSKWSHQGEKEYPYLPPRKYTFEVKAVNVYSNESSVTSFTFKVRNPWYLSGLAIIIYTLIGVVIIALIMLIQQKKYTEEKTIITESKEREIKIKDEEINKISNDSKKEIDRITNEKLRTELNLKNDQLTTITMHLMNKSEFMQEVRKKIENNIYQGGSKDELKKILKNIDDNITDNDSWDQFAYHFDQVHGDYLQKLAKSNVRLSPREIKLAAFLRMNMSSKEISNLMNITVRGVELARYRLRKKLNLGRDQNLVEYLIELDLD